ncbi:aminotransferase class I/II-fold pyridoxal phosphate-dependent enzyme [Jannaschia formosa]|uniref:aminotransferase class I/II-fold pyridoxal phosphate-dependent enzyme n=1 Tax=Jannaschia formosa TaxID=2259592 RepID=UPI000E1BE9F7|nr:aminotransferase class I/II-fold pyridoxal phosphate-dependent enzyme [Jannaschia formosa]TFL17832.1 aminotransferase class I/II-fold pyridoxal phosphate-dependent enzyme [Jannaschia formosa]
MRDASGVSGRSKVDPFIVMDVMERARALEEAGRSIVHMEVGQPGTAAPAAARAALAAAMDAGPLGYTVALGLPELRARIARHYGEWYGVDLDPARVVVTSGASGGFLLAFTALFDAGQRVGLGLPGYPSYRHILTALSLEAVGISTRAEDRYQPRPGDVTTDLDGLILASPGNPTGTMLDRDALAALAGACRNAGAALISDEIYHGLDYGSRAVSALEVDDGATVVGSFSKYFSMTGWRVGWLVVPQAHVRTYERLAQNMFICAPHASQIAALAAMEAEEELQANRAVYAENRRLMMEGLPRAGLDRIAPPDGAFYVYADVSALTDDSLAFAARILDEAGVAVTPGLDFDPARGARTLRFSYARATADIVEGLDRLARFMAAR